MDSGPGKMRELSYRCSPSPLLSDLCLRREVGSCNMVCTWLAPCAAVRAVLSGAEQPA